MRGLPRLSGAVISSSRRCWRRPWAAPRRRRSGRPTRCMRSACALASWPLRDGAGPARASAAVDVAGLRDGRLRGGRAGRDHRGGAVGDDRGDGRRRGAGARSLAGEPGAGAARWSGWPRSARCRCWRSCRSARGVAARAPGGALAGVQPGRPGGAARLCLDGDDAARRRAVRVPAAGRRRAGDGHDADRHGARRADGRGPAAGVAPPSGHRRPHGPRQPAAPALAPGGGDRRERGRGRAAADRPRRLQGAQRHARPRGRRRGADADRAAAARRRCSPGDTLARLGGDEFAVVLVPGDEASASRRLAAAARGAGALVRGRRDPRAHRRVDRHRAVPRARRRRDRAAAARRRRDVRGQAHAHRARGLPARARPSLAPAPGAAGRAARRARRTGSWSCTTSRRRRSRRARCAASRRWCGGRIRGAGC